jgi:hypothetical protein
MAIRTTSGAVEGIIEVDAAISLTPFIETASALVDEIATDSGHDATRLELIERWLSAHFYAIRDPRTTQEKAGTVGASYESKVDLALDLTRYGQQAMVLDSSGLLRSLSSKKGRRQASVTWLGTEPDE